VTRPDHYATLGVPATATDAQIKAAFRRLARRFHPDAAAPEAGRPVDSGDDRRFKAIARAYATLGRPGRRRAYDTRRARGRFGQPGADGPASYVVEGAGPVYHSDLGHHSDFYQAGDPLTVAEAGTVVGRDPGWLRRAIRTGRLSANRDDAGRYLLRRRDVERLDRTAPRRPRATVVDDRSRASTEDRSAADDRSAAEPTADERTVDRSAAANDRRDGDADVDPD
jgi:curved DNA-binding protein CbpA